MLEPPTLSFFLERDKIKSIGALWKSMNMRPEEPTAPKSHLFERTETLSGSSSTRTRTRFYLDKYDRYSIVSNNIELSISQEPVRSKNTPIMTDEILFSEFFGGGSLSTRMGLKRFHIEILLTQLLKT